MNAADAAKARGYRRWPLVAAGILMGIYSTLCGIGGGIFAVPLLHFVYGQPLRTAVANSLVLVAASTTGATVLELLHAESALRFDLIAILIVTSFFGARLGFALSRKLSTRALKLVFVVLLTAVALQLVFAGPRDDVFGAAPRAAAPLTQGEIALVSVIGFAAGIVAPLLGIGGGLIAVPSLLYGLPSLGFLVARACSMAMSTCTAWQSLWLYRRDGELKSTISLWLAAGALLGSVIGIQLVHVDVVTRSARGLVAFAMLFAAVRFAWDLWTTRRAARR